MKGMDLSRRFYDHCRPALMDKMPDVMALAAIGLVGEGSECFGMDDELSRDHDFGPGFCIWLPLDLLCKKNDEIERVLADLPAEFAGRPSRLAPRLRGGRVGPLPLERFYSFFTGLDHAPASWREWMNIPEERLAAVTNGQVFEDNAGNFTAWRLKLLDYYPRDVWLKKLATRVMIMGQAGQYNLPRTLKRNAPSAAMLAMARFVEAALSMVFLLNRRYMPFYKWAPVMVADLAVLGSETDELLKKLAAHPLRGPMDIDAAEMIEDYCVASAAKLRAFGLSEERDSFLWAHGPQIMAHVREPEIRALDLLRD